jgi:hypothetical protein
MTDWNEAIEAAAKVAEIRSTNIARHVAARNAALAIAAAIRALARPEGDEVVKRVAASIWRETYRHDTLVDWHELRLRTMYWKRTMAAARAAIAAIGDR